MVTMAFVLQIKLWQLCVLGPVICNKAVLAVECEKVVQWEHQRQCQFVPFLHLGHFQGSQCCGLK